MQFPRERSLNKSISFSAWNIMRRATQSTTRSILTNHPCVVRAQLDRIYYPYKETAGDFHLPYRIKFKGLYSFHKKLFLNIPRKHDKLQRKL